MLKKLIANSEDATDDAIATIEAIQNPNNAIVVRMSTIGCVVALSRMIACGKILWQKMFTCTKWSCSYVVLGLQILLLVRPWRVWTTAA